MAAGWNYDKHPAFSDDLLKGRALLVLRAITDRKPLDLRLLIQDTRRLHLAYFENLTPPDASYFAGNYRGSNFPRLRNYNVDIGTALSGCPARFVDAQMSGFSNAVASKVQILDLMWSNDALTPDIKLYRLAELTCALYVTFLTIHPYADGNGHMSRFIVIALFSIYGIKFSNFPLHPRPPTVPPLHVLLTEYRSGNRALLIKMMLDNVKA